MSDESKVIEAKSGADEQTQGALQGDKSAETNLENLQQQLQAKTLEATNNYDRFIRQVAELENFKRRSAKEREEAIRFANEGLIKDLLPILDNLERAVSHAASGDNGKSFTEGVEMILKAFLDVLAKHGVTQIAALGQPFDPSKHEAMAQIETSGHKHNSIVEEHHKGYLFRERLLRPALVSVAKALNMQEKKNNERKVENNPADD
jgi:molecular chaperone GrpE